MRHDPLNQLLRQADASAAPPPVGANLAGRIRCRERRRRQLRVGASAAIALVLGAWICLGTTRPHGRIIVEDPAHWRAELASLDVIAAGHVQAAKSLEGVEEGGRRLGLIELQLVQPDVLERVEAARDFAGWVLVREADRMRNQPAHQAEAMETYRRAVRLFPGSTAAGQAMQQLGSNGA